MSNLSPSPGKIPVAKNGLIDDTLRIASDGYKYSNAGPEPDDAPTGEPFRKLYETQPDFKKPELSRLSTRVLGEKRLRIFKRNADLGWRAKMADEESMIATDDEHDQQPIQTPRVDSQLSGPSPPTIEEREILHNWTQEMHEGSLTFLLNVVTNAPGNIQRKSRHGHIGWIHSEEQVPTRAKFEKLFSESVSKAISSEVRGLTRRLLKRVWTTDEREFIGGKYLVPSAIRYDGQVKEDEKPCTFFSFPYFAVHEPEMKTTLRSQLAEGSQNYPVRTLLQARYRLETTSARDHHQSVTTLRRADMISCVRPIKVRTKHERNKKVNTIIHVPQLWGLSLSGDVMVTSGPISLTALQGTVVRFKETTVKIPQGGHGPSLVRIFLDHSGRKHQFTYPTAQCDWWFGLLNKQEQILIYIGDFEIGAKSENYKFYTKNDAQHENLVTILNWTAILRMEASEIVDLWMKRDTPSVEVTSAGPSDTSKPQREASAAAAGNESHATSHLQGKSLTTGTIALGHTSDHPSSIITIAAAASLSERNSQKSSANHSTSLYDVHTPPFLVWRLVDDFGDADKRPQHERLEYFLNRLGRAIPHEYIDSVEERLPSHLEAELSAEAKVSNIERLRNVQQRSYRDVINKLKESGKNGGKRTTAIKNLFSKCEVLMRLFVYDTAQSSTQLPQNKDVAEHITIKQYWGVVYMIAEYLVEYQYHMSDVEELSKGLSSIIQIAVELHHGMLSLRSVQETGKDISGATTNAEVGVLLTVMVDALKSVFCVLFGAAHYLGMNAGPETSERPEMAQFIRSHVNESCKLLETAKDRLVVEAGGASSDKGIGPVVSPEAIIIMLLDRLSQGVYGEGTIDIIELYEKIVEKIALQVEKHASRRLLLEINRVSEELDIIHDVLRQQKSVVSLYRQSLDPDTFKEPSIPRKMKFGYESTSIDRILKSISERIIDCVELRERASRLAVQNVQLVETQQDDNSKAILVFTVVTITFLPLTFVTGFFGMNLAGIVGTTSSVKHFWVIAVPVTFGVVVMCLLIAYSGAIKRYFQARKEKML